MGPGKYIGPAEYKFKESRVPFLAVKDRDPIETVNHVPGTV